MQIGNGFKQGANKMSKISRRTALKGLVSASLLSISVYPLSTYAQAQNRYYLRHEFSGKYICSGATENGGGVWLWGPIPEGHEARYKYKLISVGGGYYYLRHEFSEKYICSGGTENGNALWLWGPIPQGHEGRYKFKFISLGGGYYYLRHQYSGKYICSGETENDGALWLWGPIPEGHEARYKFKLTPAA